MGPGCFYPGNATSQDIPIITGLLQWGRDVSIPEMMPLAVACCGDLGFNGAGMFLSRKSRRIPRKRRFTWRFNGAGMFLSRKYCWRRHPHHSHHGFNGAGMFLSRKYRLLILNGGKCPASMGPGCFYPGNKRIYARYRARTLLQWGRDVSIPEM